MQIIPFKGDRLRLLLDEPPGVLAGLKDEKVYYDDRSCIIEGLSVSKDIFNRYSVNLRCEGRSMVITKGYELEKLVFIRSIENLNAQLLKTEYYYNGPPLVQNELNGQLVKIKNKEEFDFVESFYCKISKQEYGVCIRRKNGEVYEIETMPPSKLDMSQLELKGMGFETFTVALKSSLFDSDFDNSNPQILDRKVIYRDPGMIIIKPKETGTITYKACITRNGSISYIEIDESQTTIHDPEVLKQVIQSLSKYKYEAVYSGPKEQCGQYSINFNGIDKF